MTLKKLVQILEKQEKNLKNLLKISIDKKEILIASNHQKLTELTAIEEQCILNIQITEEERLLIMRDLFKEYKIDNERYKLEVLIEGLNGKVDNVILNGISMFEKRVKKIIKEITRNNQLNMALIQQSRSLINATIHAVINTGNKSMLDRKG
jgi:molecular chaperone DnaK (HSP70)